MEKIDPGHYAVTFVQFSKILNELYEKKMMKMHFLSLLIFF